MHKAKVMKIFKGLITWCYFMKNSSGSAQSTIEVTDHSWQASIVTEKNDNRNLTEKCCIDGPVSLGN